MLYRIILLFMISAIPFSCTKNEVIENPKPDPSLQGVDLSPIMIVNVNDEEYTITDFENRAPPMPPIIVIKEFFINSRRLFFFDIVIKVEC